MNNQFRCSVCGRFVSLKDLDEGNAVHRMIMPDSDFSFEEFETLCKDHYVPFPEKRIINEDVHPIKRIKSILKKFKMYRNN